MAIFNPSLAYCLRHVVSQLELVTCRYTGAVGRVYTAQDRPDRDAGECVPRIRVGMRGNAWECTLAVSSHAVLFVEGVAPGESFGIRSVPSHQFFIFFH